MILHAEIAIPDSERYHEKSFLITIVEDIVVFLVLKGLKPVYSYIYVFPAVEMRQSLLLIIYIENNQFFKL